MEGFGIANSVRTVLKTAATGRQGGSVIRHMLLNGWRLRARTEYAQKAALLVDLLKVQSNQADTDHKATRTLLDLGTAQANLAKTIGGDE